ncbi:MAG: GH39 family glycosyl hydrolase, partial [Alphaproteobacteria bacterium]
MNKRFLFGLMLTLVATASIRAAERPSGRRPFPPRRPRGVVTHVPSTAGGREGIAVRIVAPQRPRYEAGAPVAISVAGGHQAGNATSRMNVAGCGFVEVSFAFPGGGQGEAKSGGSYDHRGPKCVEALRDVILFALGKHADKQGRKIQNLLGDVRVLTSNVGLHGGSHGGNACGAVMGLHGADFPELAWYVSMESPYGEGAVGAELGSRRGKVCPAYNPETGVLDLTTLAFDPRLEIRPFGSGRFGGQSPPALTGGLFFDMDGDGKCESEADYRLQPPVFDVGQGRQSWYSIRLLREAERRRLFGDRRPAHMPTLKEAVEFWRYRDATGLVADAVRKVPNVAVIVVAGATDHVQLAPDHPHIRAQVNAFQKAGAKLIRLNPDRVYVEWLFDRKATTVPDNDAGLRYTPWTIAAALCPDRAAPKQLLSPAAMCELADRAQLGNWTKNLDAVLFPDALRAAPTGARPAGRPGASAPSRPAPDSPASAARPAPGKPYGQGVKQLEVDCAKAAGEIRSLLGVNRGPLSFPRRSGEKTVSHLESYRTLGIDFIRTHDFYGPTDWHVIFPDWSADADDPASYDFQSSDVRIKAICENGFRCLYRLGTSWKGRRTQPINDPPGTLRGPDGQVTHRADRADFRKWAKICVQTVRHYTEGWKDGFRFPIEYWEIWNEPDLAAQFWTGTPQQYYLMYEEAAKAIKAANPQLKVGGPACTGILRESYVEDFILYCREREAPLDFFTWHSYGGRGDFNPQQYYRDALR